MDRLRNYEVSFSGLKDGKHTFQFEIDQKFFTLFETEQEFTQPKIIATIFLEKHSTFLEFLVETRGEVTLICDITNEEFAHPLENSVKVLVKFGETFDDSNDEVITIPHGEHAFNVAQLIYENVILAIPMKKVAPGAEEESSELLEKFSEKEEEPEGDPRWDALKKLKNKK